MSSIEFTVIGCPKPQQRPRAVNRGGFSKVYSPSSEWKQQVVLTAAKLQEQGNYYDQPLSVTIQYFYHRPKSHYGTGKNADKLKPSAPTSHTKKPDLDNLNKAILDAIGDGGLWKDDSIIWQLTSAKYYIGKQELQRATILIEE